MNTTVMSISVAYSEAKKYKSPFDEIEKLRMLSLCYEIVLLNDKKMQILQYLESRIRIVAPNICEIIGPKITSKLVSTAGGINELAKIPASNIQVIGSEKKALNGLSAAHAGIHRGFLSELEMVKNAP